MDIKIQNKKISLRKVISNSQKNTILMEANNTKKNVKFLKINQLFLTFYLVENR